MNHTQQSTDNSNIGQSRDRRCNLSARRVRLHKASTNVINFGLPKTRYVVPEPNHPNMLTSLYKSFANPSYQSKFMSIGPKYEKTYIKRFSLMLAQYCLCHRLLFYLCKISILFFTGVSKLSFNPS
jgi:hypothetical protein